MEYIETFKVKYILVWDADCKLFPFENNENIPFWVQTAVMIKHYQYKQWVKIFFKLTLPNTDNSIGFQTACSLRLLKFCGSHLYLIWV